MSVQTVRTLLAVSILWASIGASAQPVQESVFKQLFPNPTGQNGYEEIVMAGELAKGCEGLATDGRSTLTEKRRLLSNPDAIRALALFRQGLKKPIHAPHGTTGEPRFEAFSAIRALARLLMVEQYVLLADGKVGAAIDSLRDGLTLGYAIARDAILGGLVASAVDMIVVRTLERHIEQLSVRDCDRLRKLAVDWLNMPDPAIDALEAERILMHKRLQEQLGGTNAELGSQAMGIIDARIDVTVASLRSPYWERKELPELTGNYPAEQYVRNLGIEEIFDQALNRFARDQAWVQILGVHAAIRSYKWENNRLPDSLEQLRLGRMVIDPFTGKPLIYKRTGDNTYELTSEGLKPIPPS